MRLRPLPRRLAELLVAALEAGAVGKVDAAAGQMDLQMRADRYLWRPPSPHVARTPVPTLLRAGPYRLFIFMSDCVEPHHVHVEGNDGLAKFWLRPVSLAEHVGYSPRELHRIRRVVEGDRAVLIQAIDTVCERA